MNSPYGPLLEKLMTEGGTAYGVAAVYVRPTTANDQDGYTWRVLLGDGDGTGEIDVTLSATEALQVNGEIDAERVEVAVEKLTGSYPLETRLKDVLAEKELVLSAVSFD